MTRIVAWMAHFVAENLGHGIKRLRRKRPAAQSESESAVFRGGLNGSSSASKGQRWRMPQPSEVGRSDHISSPKDRS
jgi:hypothetical protein